MKLRPLTKCGFIIRTTIICHEGVFLFIHSNLVCLVVVAYQGERLAMEYSIEWMARSGANAQDGGGDTYHP
jgi:hypothetical protein